MNKRNFLKSLLGLAALLPASIATAGIHVNLRAPLTLLKSRVAGFQYYAGENLWQAIAPGDELWLLREPGNPHDNQAVALFWKGYKIGYVPRRDNTVIAQLLDRGIPLECRITEKNESPDPWQRIRFSVNLAV